MQLTSLIGKPVLSPTGDRCGYIVEARPDRTMKKLACLVCADENEELFYVPARAVLSSLDAVLIGRTRLDAPSGVPSPVGRPVYSHGGEALGLVNDLVLGERPALSVEGILHGSIPLSLVCIGESVILYPDEAARRRAEGKRRGKETASRKRPEKSAQGPAADAPSDAQISPVGPTPLAVRLNRTDLLGRTVQTTVFTPEGQTIARAGEHVTPEILGAARRANCLLRLAAGTFSFR